MNVTWESIQRKFVIQLTPEEHKLAIYCKRVLGITPEEAIKSTLKVVFNSIEENKWW